MDDKKQRLVLSILDFLSESMADGTVKEEDKEGLEVAIQSIGEAFGIDPTNSQQRERLSVRPANLQSIFDVYLKTRDKLTSEPRPTPEPSTADKAEAEKLKQLGNSQMSRKEYTQAIESYTKAISLHGANAVYYSNRAAAHSSLGDHAKAIEDAEKAIETDPNFVKAFSRLGHAHYSLGDYTSATFAFQRGLELEPDNFNLKSGLEQAEARARAESAASAVDAETLDAETPNTSTSGPGGGMPDLSGLASMLGGMGSGGGMPNLSSLMSNPAVMQMAQNLMANGGMDRFMQNPAVAGMMNRMQSGGGMPSMQEIMNDPNLRELASSFGGGARPGGGQSS